MASVPLAWWLGVLSMPWLYCVGIVLGMCSVAGGAAEQLVLTFLVGRDAMIDAQAKFTLTESLARVSGPGLAGLLVQAVTAPVAVLVDAAGILFSGWMLGRIRIDEPEPAPAQQHPLADMRDGLLFIWRTALLRVLALAVGLWHVLMYASGALGILFATRELGLSPGALGAAQMIGGMGGLASSFLVRTLTARFGQMATVQIGLAMTTLSFLMTPLIPAAPFGYPAAAVLLYGASTFIFVCGLFIFLLPYVALRQKVTPDAMLGRMISTMRFLTVGCAPLGALAGGALGQLLGVRPALLAIALLAAFLCVCMLASRTVRSVRS